MKSKDLTKLGLSTNESKIYLALLELGHALAGEISKKTQINRTTTYDSLERMIEKGIVAFFIQANRKVFQPISPDRFLDIVREQEIAVKEIVPKLQVQFSLSKEREESNIYKGRKGIKTILANILACDGYVAFGSGGRFFEVMKYDFTIFQKRKRELGIASKVIVEESARASDYVRQAYTKFRFIPDEYSSLTTTFVYGDNVAIVIWSEVPVAVVIKSRGVAESYSHYFNLLWKQASR
jgi:sugar-specific transcriptional regulator TrmB